MAKINELSEKLQDFAVQNIIRSGDILYNHYLDVSERLVKSLLFIHSSGIALVLGYIKYTSHLNFHILTSFFMFVLGLVLILFRLYYDYLIYKKQLTHYSDDTHDFFANKIDFNNIRHFSGKKYAIKGYDIILFIAILCVFGGLSFGAVDIYCHFKTICLFEISVPY
jgi:hypothetical protein